jgi:AbrB family looped-hinge helix DNA binding protein
MKKYSKVIRCDERGQLVIPKDIRAELGIDEGTGFWMHYITKEGILLKKVDVPDLQNESMIEEIKEKSDKLGLKKENLKRALKDYKKQEGNFEVI